MVGVLLGGVVETWFSEFVVVRSWVHFNNFINI